MIALSRLAPIAATALADSAGDPVEPSRGRWDMTQRGTPIAAVLDGAWLVMTAPVPDAAAPRDLLAQNATLPGLLKFALSADGEPQLRAEIPLDEDATPHIRETRSGFGSVLAALGGDRCLPLACEPARPVSQDDIKRLCDEAGWTSAPRGEDACTVELECPGTFLQATLSGHRGGVRMSVELEKCEPSAEESVSAIVVLLLTAGSTVRMVRPILETREGRVVPAFEVTFSAVPTAAHLAHALSALSVACRLCAEEIRALHDPNVAREFLALSKTTTRKEPAP